MVESIFIDPLPIIEDGEAPRWRFSYDNFKNDPRPDILLLGAYIHPRTGNNLVGGVNLHYLDKRQVDDLARALPIIMSGNNLKGRVRELRKNLPEIFRFYRTYNAAYIRGVNKDVMYPKLGMVKATKNWLAKTFGGLFKSPKQRSQDAEPKYPDDLSAMNTRLDQVVQQLQKAPPQEAQPDSPELQAARDEFIKSQNTQTKSGIADREGSQLTQATQDIETTATRPDTQPTSNVAAIRPAQVSKPSTPLPSATPTEYTPPTVTAPPTTTTPTQTTPEEPDDEMMTEPSEDGIPELRDISDANEDKSELEESITYYSPVHKRYITEALTY